MKATLLGLVSFAVPAVANNACSSSEYYSPNLAKCVPKKMEGQYCNAVQKCLESFCRNNKCSDGSRYPTLPTVAVPSDAAWQTHQFGEATNIVKVPQDCQTGGELPPCMFMSMEINRPQGGLKFKLTMGMHAHPAYLFPDGSIREYTAVPVGDHPQSSYFVEQFGTEPPWIPHPFNGNLFHNDDHSTAYNTPPNWPPGVTSVTHNLFEKEVFGQFYEVDPATGLADMTKPNIMASYAIVIAEDDVPVSVSPPVELGADLPGSACFTPPVNLECPTRLRWGPGGAKFTKALVDLQPTVYPSGTKYRFVEVFDFTGTDDFVWAAATMNHNTPLTELEENVAYPIHKLVVPQNLVGEYDIVGTDAFILDFSEQQYEYRGTPWGMSHAFNNEFEITIRGRQVLIASYEEIGEADDGMYFQHYMPEKNGAGLYEVRMYPSVLPVARDYVTPAATMRSMNREKGGLEALGALLSLHLP